MEYLQICHGSFKAILVLVAGNVENHTVTMNHVITGYRDRFNHMDGIMRALAKK